MNTTRAFFTALPVLFVIACGGAPPPAAVSAPSAAPDSISIEAAPQEAAESTEAPAPQVASVASRASTTTPQPQPQPQQAKTNTAPKTDPKSDAAQSADFLIMYNGDVTMGVDGDKVSATLDRILDVAENVGGHLAVRRDQSIQIRVPSPRFREALGKISELGDVMHQSVSAEDVSEEYHDAEVRLTNLKATQKRLQDFLSKSASLSDMLTLEHELERVAMDIDRIEGRMRYLREHVALSTLNVALVARARSQVVAGGGKIAAAPRIMKIDAPWLDDMGVPKLEN